jgi:hypothetical protein
VAEVFNFGPTCVATCTRAAFHTFPPKMESSATCLPANAEVASAGDALRGLFRSQQAAAHSLG